MADQENIQIEGQGEEQNTIEFGPWLPVSADNDNSLTIAQMFVTIQKLQDELNQTRSQTEALAAWGASNFRANPDTPSTPLMSASEPLNEQGQGSQPDLSTPTARRLNLDTPVRGSNVASGSGTQEEAPTPAPVPRATPSTWLRPNLTPGLL